MFFLLTPARDPKHHRLKAPEGSWQTIPGKGLLAEMAPGCQLASLVASWPEKPSGPKSYDFQVEHLLTIHALGLLGLQT